MSQQTLLTDELPTQQQPQQTAIATTPLAILERAVDRGLDADQLDKLMAMQERWERNQAEKAYNEAMHLCQQQMPSVVKSSTNKQTNSNYADLEAVQKAARPVYSAHGFSLCYGEADCPAPNYKRTTCDVRHVGGHCVRHHLDLPVDGIGPKGNAIGGMNAVQGCISTTSYGQRRLLCMIFNITLAGEDDDGQGAFERVTEKELVTLEEWVSMLEPTAWKLPPFLRWLGVESLGQLKRSDFGKAVHELQAQAHKHGVTK